MIKYPEPPFLTIQKDQLQQAPQKTEELPMIEIVTCRDCITDISRSNCDDCVKRNSSVHIIDTDNNLDVNKNGSQEI